MTTNKLPQRTPRISEDQQAEICRLALHQVPAVEIARRVGVHRTTVRRVLERTRAALVINADMDGERAEAIALYRECQRQAWEALEDAMQRGRQPAALLAEIRQCQTRIDTLLGLEPPKGDDPFTLLSTFKVVVGRVIQTEAPELAPVIAQRLLEATREHE